MAIVDTPWSGFPVKATIIGADILAILDSAAANLNKTITADTVGVFVTTAKTYAGLTTTAKTIQGAINEVHASIIAESLWDRDTSGTPFLHSQNAGDDINMTTGDIYSISSLNTSSTKSYQIVPTLIGVVPGSEHAKVEFKGLWEGNEKTFMEFAGSSNDFNVYSQNWVYTSAQATVISVLDYKVNVSATGGAGWFFNRVTGKNSGGVDTIYYRDRAIISVNTTGSESGIHVFDVMQGGTLTEYMRLDGGTQKVTHAKPLEVTGSITSIAAGTDGFSSLDDAAGIEKVRWDTNGDSWITGGDTGFGNSAPGAKVDITGDFRTTLPSGLGASGSAYTTGANLNATPAAVGITLTENVDVNGVWAVNSPATGNVTYSDVTRYFQVHSNITILTASGGASTITVKIQKQIAAGGWVDVVGAVASKYLSGTNDQGALPVSGIVSMSSGDDLRLEIASSSDTPTYTFTYASLIISAFN